MPATPLPTGSEPGHLLLDLFDAGVRAAAPGPLVARALEHEPPGGPPIHLIAIGKAAVPMADAALAAARAAGCPTAAGLVVTTEEGALPGCQVLAADHPLPGARSLRASHALAAFVAGLAADRPVWVLLSGGASSLVAGPATGIPPGDLARSFELLLGSGLDITTMNRVRKRITRWAGGGLGRALAPRPVLQLVLSDVPGNELGSIGSGPCVPSAEPTRAVLARLDGAGLTTRLPLSVAAHLRGLVAAEAAKATSARDRSFPHVRSVIVGDNATARTGVVARAAELGLAVERHEALLAGAAVAEGTRIGEVLARSAGGARPLLHLWGGEPVVTLHDGAGLGGRAQELALAAARVLGRTGAPATLLAAGTDGRDGPTDAAGAIVDRHTWAAIAAQGVDPEGALQRHDAYPALASAGALIEARPTGTNVLDLYLGLAN